MPTEPPPVASPAADLPVEEPTGALPRERRRRVWADEAGVAASELILVVVVLIGLIAAAAWAIHGINADTATTNCETALRNLKVATEQYHAENDAYPVDKGVLIDLGYVTEDEVSGWRLELSNAVTPTYTGIGSCG